MKIVFLFITTIILFSCSDDKTIMEKQVKSAPVLELPPFAKKAQDTVYVVSFWKSDNEESLKQLPAFEKLRKDYSNEKVRVISISLDKRQELEKSIEKIVKDYDISSDIILAGDQETKQWISKVSPFWSGSVPATFIIYKNQKDYYGYGLSYNELKSFVESKINPDKK